MQGQDPQRPIPMRSAFGDNTYEALLSRSALLLTIGAKLRPDWSWIWATIDEYRDEIDIPELELITDRFQISEVGRFLAKRNIQHIADDLSPSDDADSIAHSIVEQLYEERDPFLAAALVAICVRSNVEIVRVSAAVSYIDLFRQPRRVTEILLDALKSDSGLVRDIAAAGLARVEESSTPPVSNVDNLVQPRSSGRAWSTSAFDSLLVHGTFAQNASWWKPSGSFHYYLTKTVGLGLYDGSHPFSWNGGYSDRARELGAKELSHWLQNNGCQRARMICHSHGGSVAMLVSRAGFKVDDLILLSCPVHWGKYSPDFNSVSRTVSIRVKYDLVILADRGGQSFTDSRIDEHTLPLWFHHKKTREAHVWKKYKIPNLL